MIVFCGYANTDLTVRVPELPGPGARVQATSVRYGEGGMAANAAVAAARAGADARFAGVVGPGEPSTAFLESLADDGVGTGWTARTGTLTTAVVLLTPDGERSIISQDDEVGTAHIAALLPAAVEAGAGWLYLDGYRFPAAAAVLDGVPRPRVVVDLDGCDGPEAMLAALSVADHAIVGRAQANGTLGGDAALAAAAVTQRVHMVVTDGPRGWTMLTPGGARHDGEAITVATVDDTGAGDCFAGTYCAELDRGASPLEAARFAAVAAGLSCTRAGARDGLPRRAEVIAHIEAQGRPPRGAEAARASARPEGEET